MSHSVSITNSCFIHNKEAGGTTIVWYEGLKAEEGYEDGVVVIAEREFLDSTRLIAYETQYMFHSLH